VTALEWRTALDERDTADVLALLDAATAEDGVEPVGEHVLLHLRGAAGPDVGHLVARDGSGAPVGYAFLDLTDPAGGVGELAVHPAARRRGVGTALVTGLLERTAAAPGQRPLRLWAHGQHPGAVRLAEGLGFRQVRALWRMGRDLTGPFAAALPAGVRLRPFAVGRDEAAFLRVNNAAFDWHPEQGGWGVEQVKLREAEAWFDADGFLLAVEDAPDGGERLLGFHWTKVHASGGGAAGDEPIGEVYVLGVDPAARGRKLGEALTLAGLEHLRGRGLRQVMLYVEADNEAAVRVYRNLGFTRWDTDVAYLR
jgi:mycothiol synthase